MTTAEYNQCVDNYADSVYRFILKNIKDEETARDVVQDAFMKMWEKRDEVSGEKRKSYLFTSAYHTMIDRIRKDRRMTRIDDNPTWQKSSYDSDGYTDLKEVLDEALDKLPEIQKSVVLLRDYEGYSYDEIGEITGLNESQVKVYIYRARVSLKNYIQRMDLVI
jgi:RNA polymerase sigma-70 factor (ECF subfamily)